MLASRGNSSLRIQGHLQYPEGFSLGKCITRTSNAQLVSITKALGQCSLAHLVPKGASASVSARSSTLRSRSFQSPFQSEFVDPSESHVNKHRQGHIKTTHHCLSFGTQLVYNSVRQMVFTDEGSILG